MTDESGFTDAERDAIVADLTEEDLRQRSQALHDTQEIYEELHYLSVQKMPCPECSGAGSIIGGSLSDLCPTCLGRRVIEQPGATHVEMPPFAELRAAITTYGNALADRELPEGHKGKRHLALPAPATVPSLEQIQKLNELGLQKVRQLSGEAPGVVPKRLLSKAKKAKGMQGDGDLGDHTDRELDEIEDADLEDQ